MILWFMLSNLLVIEILFNIYGITNFVYRHGNPAVFTIASMLVFIPMYAFFVLGSMWTNKWAVQNEMAATAAAQSSFSFQPYWLIIKRFFAANSEPASVYWSSATVCCRFLHHWVLARPESDPQLCV